MTSEKRGTLSLIMTILILLFTSMIESYGEGKATIEYKYDGVGNLTERR